MSPDSTQTHVNTDYNTRIVEGNKRDWGGGGGGWGRKTHGTNILENLANLRLSIYLLYLLFTMFLFEQLSMSTDNGVDAHRPILCMPIRNNKFEIIGKLLNNMFST